MKPSRDIQPVTGFRANAAQYIDQVRETGMPLYLTQHGKGAAVLLDVATYEQMVEELELLRDVRLAEEQVTTGSVSSHEDASEALRARLRR